MADTEIMCKDCGDRFVLTAKDKAFFSSMGFDLPKRCKACRRKKKERNEGR